MAGGTSRHDKKRKSAQNTRYINERRHEKSHIRKIQKHLENPNHADNDLKAAERLKEIKTKIGMR